jgi:hypothetical protein
MKLDRDDIEETLFLRCRCSDNEHSVIFDRYKSKDFHPEIVVSVHLDKLSFFKRLKAGIKYVLFGTSPQYGHYAEVLLGTNEMDKLQTFLREASADIAKEADDIVSNMPEFKK